ncbi:trypsin-like serine protease [Pseudoalteromonas sp. CO342X]|uniref:trypsin-like serine protease n=1 Tax=Pseudoalteromonas sp. CO342X TaxID=1777270 RepID=UPI001F107A0A|nr:trypsin-like serine protease [Pseudoalteromonas sp. CO342X]
MMKYLAIFLLMFASFQNYAVVKRHDVDPDLYKVNSIPQFYVDMPFQGGSVLIDKHWLLAPAHVIYTFMYDYQDKPIMVHGVENQIAQIIIHPDYKKVEGDWSEGDPAPLMEQLNNAKDIALIRLSKPITHIQPIAIYEGNEELGMEITGFGRGAIGTGITGEEHDSEGPSLTTYAWYQVTKFFSDWAFTQDDYQMHVYNNVITEAKAHWLRFTFEQGADALPLEGTIGSGDSGGAAIIYQGSTPVLVGLAAWREIEGDLENYTLGKYGSTAVLTRVSYYQDWINKHINKGQ